MLFFGKLLHIHFQKKPALTSTENIAAELRQKKKA
jgi:hypothetical protein